MKPTKPRKQGHSAANSASVKGKLLRGIHGILHALQRPFLAAFWWLEKRMARLQDQLESEGAR
jgi:hypothetical protein